MNKTELINYVAETADITKAAAALAVDGMVDAILESLKKGEQVTVIGFGTFSVRERAARTGRNPQTGATIEIKASRNVAFKAGKQLREAVQ